MSSAGATGAGLAAATLGAGAVVVAGVISMKLILLFLAPVAVLTVSRPSLTVTVRVPWIQRLAVVGVPYAWVALVMGLIGAVLLFWASVLLIVESRIGLTAVFDEMEFVQALGRHYAPPDNLAGRHGMRIPWRR